MTFDPAFAWEILPQLIRALGITVVATLLGFLLAAVFGLVFFLLRRSPWKLIALPARWFVEFVRSTPLLVQIYFLFYLPPHLGIRLSPMVTGVFALGLHYGAYLAEVYRAGVEGVPRGQWEAARALNFSAAQRWRLIILPQAIPLFRLSGTTLWRCSRRRRSSQPSRSSKCFKPPRSSDRKPFVTSNR